MSTWKIIKGNREDTVSVKARDYLLAFGTSGAEALLLFPKIMFSQTKLRKASGFFLQFF